MVKDMHLPDICITRDGVSSRSDHLVAIENELNQMVLYLNLSDFCSYETKVEKFSHSTDEGFLEWIQSLNYVTNWLLSKNCYRHQFYLNSLPLDIRQVQSISFLFQKMKILLVCNCLAGGVVRKILQKKKSLFSLLLPFWVDLFTLEF